MDYQRLGTKYAFRSQRRELEGLADWVTSWILPKPEKLPCTYSRLPLSNTKNFPDIFLKRQELSELSDRHFASRRPRMFRSDS